jgi:hypothetical protein
MEISIVFLVIASLRLLGKGEGGREEDGTAWRDFFPRSLPLCSHNSRKVAASARSLSAVQLDDSLIRVFYFVIS